MLRLLNKDKIVFAFSFLISILIILISVFGPLKLTSTTYSSDSKIQGDNLSINLLEPVPKIIMLEVYKINSNGFENRLEIKSSAESENLRSLVVDVENSLLTIKITQTKFYEQIELNDNIKNFKIYFDQLKKSLYVTRASEKEISYSLRPDEYPYVTGIHLIGDSESQGVRAEITTLAHNRQNTITKNFGILLIVGLTALLLFRKNRMSTWVKKFNFKFKKNDWFIALTLLAVGILAPPGIDDGEILNIQRTFSNFGFASSYSNAYPLGQWWFWINSYWASFFDQILLLRLPNLLIYFMTWLILDRFIHNNIEDIDYIIKSKKYWKISGQVFETTSKILVAVGSILSFSTAYFEEPLLSFFAGSISTLSLAMLQFSSFSYSENKKQGKELNVLLEKLNLDTVPITRLYNMTSLREQEQERDDAGTST